MARPEKPRPPKRGRSPSPTPDDSASSRSPRSAASGVPWPEHALDRLGDAGYRRGGSRSQVVELLGSQTCAITALELDDRLEGVGRATVYRALEQLEELGLVQRIDLGGDSAGYEKVDPAGHHHHHILCTGCGKVVPFEDPKLEQAIHGLSGRDDFEIDSHDITLRGTCRDCMRARAESS